jgi:hypothetical protein
MPTSLPVPTVTVGQTFTDTLFNNYVRDNINKLLNQGHRILTVAQFTALSAPEDGDEVYLEVDGTNGVLWHLRYVAAEATYKWRFLGGPPLVSEITSDETTTSTSYAALSTAGPAIALPRAGDYDVTTRVGLRHSTDGATVDMSYDIGSTGAVSADGMDIENSKAGLRLHLVRSRRKTALTTETLTAKYKTSGATATFKDRLMSVTPVRIRHDA